MPIDVIDTLKQKNAAIFPLVEDTDFLGGLRVVADLAALSTIPASYMKLGMVAMLQDTGDMYRLVTLAGEWEKVEFGSPQVDLLEANCLFVTVDGGEGERGNRSKPFASVFEAMQAALDGDVILVGPGEFDEAQYLYELESKGISLIGAGVGRTLISFVEHVCLPSPGQIVRWANFSFAAEDGVSFRGGTVAWDGIEDTSMEAWAHFTDLEGLNFSGCLIGENSGRYSVTNVVDPVRVLGCEFWSDEGLRIEDALGAVQDCLFSGCTKGLELVGSAKAVVAPDCRFTDCVDAVIVGDGVEASLGGRIGGAIRATGSTSLVVEGAHGASLSVTEAEGTVTVRDSVFDGSVQVDDADGLVLSLSTVRAAALQVEDSVSTSLVVDGSGFEGAVISGGSLALATLGHSCVVTLSVTGATVSGLSLESVMSEEVNFDGITGPVNLRFVRAETLSLLSLSGASVEAFGLDSDSVTVGSGSGAASSLALRGSRVETLAFDSDVDDCSTTVEDSFVGVCHPSASPLRWVRSTLGKTHHEGWAAHPIKWSKGDNPGHIDYVTPGYLPAEGTPVRLLAKGSKVWPTSAVGVSAVSLTGLADALSEPSGRLRFVEEVLPPPFANLFSIYSGDLLIGQFTYKATGTYAVSPKNDSGLGGTVTISGVFSGGTIRESYWEFFMWGIVADAKPDDILWYGPEIPVGLEGEVLWFGDPAKVAVVRISEGYNREVVLAEGLWPTYARGPLTWEYPTARPVKQVFCTAATWDGGLECQWRVTARVDRPLETTPSDIVGETAVTHGRIDSGPTGGWNARLYTGDSINVKASGETEPLPDFLTAYLVCVLE